MAALPPMDRAQITGLVLAGGEGRRMGQEKGLALLAGQPLAARALQRLQPQVGPLALNANRRLDEYRALAQAWQAPLWTDPDPGQPCGPLAGLLTGLRHAPTDWLLTVPCDVPHFPTDLAAQLASALATEPGARLALALAPGPAGAPQAPTALAWRPQPVFCLAHRSLHDALAHDLAQGERRVQAWMQRQGALQVRMALPANGSEAALARAFANVNTPEALRLAAS